MTPEEFRSAGYRLVDWIAEYLTKVGDRPVTPNVKPGDVLDMLPDHAPAQPDGFDAVLADLDRVIVPALAHWQHPSFFA